MQLLYNFLEPHLEAVNLQFTSLLCRGLECVSDYGVSLMFLEASSDDECFGSITLLEISI